MIGPMTERGLPIVDGAPACPFVAFEDDRDERASSPDHRHRCYAEANPAPRALAHQEAYCLSSAFPVCPTFQDWARREAARSRAAGPRPTESTAAAIAADQPQRNPPRSWAAPPPWSGRGGAPGSARGPWSDEDERDERFEGGDDDEPRPPLPEYVQGLSGSFADRIVNDGAPGAGGVDGVGGGAAGAQDPDADGDEAGTWQPEEPAHPPRRRERDPGRVAALGAGGAGDPGVPSRPERRRDQAQERRRDPAPEWERARPMEAYPTLRARSLPSLSVPPMLVAVLALALAAAVLFALPGLLGFGNPAAVATATPTAGTSSALQSLPPTAVPQPTQQTYVVQAGDTMSRIAGRFGIPLGDLIAANADNIPNPDNLQIGDVVIIPVVAPTALPAASEIPAAS